MQRVGLLFELAHLARIGHVANFQILRRNTDGHEEIMLRGRDGLRDGAHERIVPPLII